MIPIRLWLVGLALSLHFFSSAQINSWVFPSATGLFQADKNSESFAFNPACIASHQGAGVLARSCNPYLMENLLIGQVGFRYTFSSNKQFHFTTLSLTNGIYANQAFNMGGAIRLFEFFSLGVEIGAYRLSVKKYGKKWGLASKMALQVGISDEITCGIVINNPMGKTHEDAIREPLTFQLSLLWELSPHLKTVCGINRDLERSISYNAGILLHLDKFEIRAGGTVQPSNLLLEARWSAFRKLSIGTELSYHFSLGFTPGIIIIYSS